MKVLLALLSALAVLGCTETSVEEAPALHLRGFRLVDPHAREQRQADLYLVDGRVSLERPAESTKLKVVEGEGRWLIPGLHDLQATLWGNASSQHHSKLFHHTRLDVALGMNLYCGVTYVLTARHVPERMRDLAKRVQLLGLQGATMGRGEMPLIGGTRKLRFGWPVTSPMAVPGTVARVKRSGAAALAISYRTKADPVRPSVSPEVMRKAVAEARRQSIPSIVEVVDWRSAEAAARAGADAILGMPLGPLPPAVLKRLKGRGVAMILPLVPLTELALLSKDPSPLDSPLLKATVPKDVLDSFRDPAAYGKNAAMAARLDRTRLLANVGRLNSSGITVLAASEAGWSQGSFHGHSVHRSMELMVESGMSIWDALASVTSEAADFMRRPVGFRTDDLADFVILDADPLVDIANTQRIVGVIHGGEVVDRDRLRPDLRYRTFKGSW